jgi:HEAT repeat protein
MEAQLSPASLERVVAKYRREVHQLAPPAPSEALAALEGHLQRRLPIDLRAFLAQQNGAVLFRDTLRIRSTNEMTPATEAVPQVVLFADAPTTGRRWGWAVDGAGGFAFGTWDGTRLAPEHATFDGWLAARIAVLEERVTTEDEEAQTCFEADPDDPYQLAAAAERVLRAGRPDEAAEILRKATARDPRNVLAWQWLGDALAGRERTAARQAWLAAFRATQLPLPYPGAPCVEAGLLRSLGQVFFDPVDWEREIERFLADQVRDARTEAEVSVVVAAASALARSRVARGKRSAGREALTDLLARCRSFTAFGVPWACVLELARLESGLGHHDETEALIRRIRHEGPPELLGPALLVLAAVAVTRQEPWAEEILDEAGATDLDDADRVRLVCLRIERALRNDRLDEATKVLELGRTSARRAGQILVDAALQIAEGDIARLRGDTAAARAAYERGLQLVDDRDPELKYRLHLRLGDVAPDPKLAARHHRTARDGFAAAELPAREGWALVRLARARREEAPRLLDAARERFLAADLAAGVAAVDSLLGDPGLSLDWHLERSTAQARLRLDAQRGRAPWERADADRPERRLGAHRLAVAACGVGVVAALAREMEACVRACAGGHGRPLDPPTIRYVAAVDLLSGHRSYEAAEVLLQQLLTGAVDGVAWRALQGAVARSPNAALVDGLLRCVESPDRHPGTAVAAAAEVLGLRREPAAGKPLSRLATSRGGDGPRRAAVTALGRIGNRSAVGAILPALEEPLVAEAAGLALLMLGDRRGIDFHAQALVARRTDLSGHPGEIVGRYGGPEYLPLLTSASDGVDDRALGALQGLGLLGDPRGVSFLLQALTQRDRRVLEVACGALQILTGHSEDWEDVGMRQRWQAWWEAHGTRFGPGTRFREGRPMEAGLLIERMGQVDPWTRRTAYDELVITTGQTLPFDADGPWRVQVAHLRGWQQWWSGARHRMPAGRWYLDGKAIS